MTHLSVPRHVPLAALFATALAAQDPAPAPAPVPGPELFERAFSQLRQLENGSFHSAESSDVAMLRRMRAMLGGQDVEVDGTWFGASRSYELESGDTLLVAGGRRVVQNANGEWRLRGATDADGKPLPWLFDPVLLHDALESLDPAARKLAHTDTSKLDAGRVTFGLTLEGQAAVDFFLSGAMPSGGGGPGPMFRIGGAGAGAGGPPEVTVDLAFEIDTAAERIERIRAKAYRTDRMPGNVQFRTAGGEEIEAEAPAEQVEEFDADGKRRHERGLPVRKLGEDVSLIEVTVRLKDLGSTPAIEVPESAAKLLRG